MLTVFDHPLITHKLALMRDKATSTKDFAQQLSEIASLMAFEVSRDLPTQPKDVETPMGICHTTELAKDVVLVPILRAGLGMVDVTSDEYVPMVLKISRMGSISISKDEKLDTNASAEEEEDDEEDGV